MQLERKVVVVVLMKMLKWNEMKTTPSNSFVSFCALCSFCDNKQIWTLNDLIDHLSGAQTQSDRSTSLLSPLFLSHWSNLIVFAQSYYVLSLDSWRFLCLVMSYHLKTKTYAYPSNNNTGSGASIDCMLSMGTSGTHTRGPQNGT